MDLFAVELHTFGPISIAVTAYEYESTGETGYEYRMNYDGCSYSGTGYKNEAEAYAAALTKAIQEVSTLLSLLVEEMENI
jgi:hypothetical protein